MVRLLRLKFGHCRLCLIARDGDEPPEEGRALVIASKYPRLTARLSARISLPCG